MNPSTVKKRQRLVLMAENYTEPSDGEHLVTMWLLSLHSLSLLRLLFRTMFCWRCCFWWLPLYWVFIYWADRSADILPLTQWLAEHCAPDSLPVEELVTVSNVFIVVGADVGVLTEEKECMITTNRKPCHNPYYNTSVLYNNYLFFSLINIWKWHIVNMWVLLLHQRSLWVRQIPTITLGLWDLWEKQNTKSE